jgi:hypothetical protein
VSVFISLALLCPLVDCMCKHEGGWESKAVRSCPDVGVCITSTRTVGVHGT